VSQLLTCIDRLKKGAWTFVQLRGKSLGPVDINRGDVDLLGSPESIDRLVKEALCWSKEGLCHVHVRRRKGRKTEFSLFSRDGSERLLFDLWSRLPQIDQGKCSLTFDQCLPLLSQDDGAIKRLPQPLEAALYLQHLVAKRKDLSQPRYQKFLQDFEERCSELADHFKETRLNEKVSKDAAVASSAMLHEAMDLNSTVASTRLAQRWQEALLTPPRRTKAISIMGCDGAGKTSLGNALVEAEKPFVRLFTGKHFYRKSFLYKLAVIFIRPLTFQSRENFDELIAPLVYLRACLGLRIKLLRWKSGITLVDRNLIDFLYLGRKQDQPRFSRFFFLRQIFGLRLPAVHCVANFDVIQSRKDEMTSEGHAAYDRDMGRALSNRCPTDYLCFNNSGELAESAEALGRIVMALLDETD
jgi:hypothetical protein